MNKNSIESWARLNKGDYLSTSRRAVAYTLANFPNTTAKEIGVRMGRPINTITPRLLELETQGIAYRSGKIGGQGIYPADTWALTDCHKIVQLPKVTKHTKLIKAIKKLFPKAVTITTQDSVTIVYKGYASK